MKNNIYLQTAILLGCLFVNSYTWTPFSQILLWKEGINWIQMIAGISVPVDLNKETVAIGSAVKAYYILPTNLSQPDSSLHKRKRSQELSYPNLYTHIEHMQNRNGNEEMKSCFLKIICEYSAYPINNHSLMSQLIDVFLRPSKISDEVIGDEYIEAETKGNEKLDCSSLFPECKTNFFDSSILG